MVAAPSARRPSNAPRTKRRSVVTRVGATGGEKTVSRTERRPERHVYVDGYPGSTMVGARRRFKLADTAQQVVGGFLLAGPFVVTEEVWRLAANMSWLQTLVTVGIVFGIGYGALYKADDRDPESETEVGGVPLRFVSLVLVSYCSVLVLTVAFGAPGTFLADAEPGKVVGGSLEAVAVTAKAVSVGAVFSVVGAATADSLF
jgi:uncharacterized membrane protein